MNKGWFRKGDGRDEDRRKGGKSDHTRTFESDREHARDAGSKSSSNKAITESGGGFRWRNKRKLDE